MTRIIIFLFVCNGFAGCSLFSSSPEVAESALARSTDEALTQAAKDGGWELRRFDINRDNQADIYKFYKVEYSKAGEILGETLARKDVDINHDGRIDVTRFYDDQQVVLEEQTDLDFDGNVDTRNFYSKGRLSKKEIDINYDGKPDLVKRYENGKLKVIESDQKGDGKLDTWEYFENDVLDRIGRDTDADGKVDVWERAAPAVVEDEAPQETEKNKADETKDE